MNIELINTGNELMLGRVLNTHHQWISRQLAAIGYEITRQMAVADECPAIQSAVREALTRADFIITTGGLGPTSDDLTRDDIARLLGLALREDPQVMAAIQDFYASRGRPVMDRVKVQAMVPEGARVLPNAMGTAPGLVLDIHPNPFRPNATRSVLVMLPGPPRELYPMFAEQVMPLLQSVFPLPQPHEACLLRTTGWGESMIEEAIAGPLRPLVEQGLEIAYCARVGEVELVLSARGELASTLVRNAGQIAREKLGSIVYGGPDDNLEKTVIHLLAKGKSSLALAESCTGGFIAHRLTNVPGASEVFNAGLVTYSNEAKTQFLGVPTDLIREHGAVSEPVAVAMAEGAARVNHTTYALAVTGIAGPAGGSEDKPVGTVFIALTTPRGTVARKFLNRLDRESFKQATAQQALDLLRRELLKVT